MGGARRRVVQRWIGIVTVVVAAAWLIRIGPRQAWSALAATAATAAALPLYVVAAALALGLLQNVMAILRLHVLARPPGSALDTVRRLAVPQLLNAIAPARAGDLAKVAVVAEHGGVARAAGSVLVADKVADAAAAAAALLLGILVSGAEAALVSWRAIALAILGAIVLAALGHAVGRRVTGGGRARQVVADLLRSVGAPGPMAAAFAMAWAGWMIESLALVVIARGVGTSLSLGGAVFALAVLNVGILVPLLPGNAGTFELALGLALTRLGVAPPAAFAIATVHHVLQLAAAVALALGAALGGRGRPRTRGISEEAKARAIDSYHRRAPRYEQLVSVGPLRWLRAAERRAVLDLARLDDPAIRTVIDVGCGDGYYTRAAKRAGKAVDAVDAAPGMVERVRSVADRAFVADLDVLELDRTYDVVLCCGVLEFVSHPEVAFARLCRLCAPGGRVVVLVPRAGAGGILYWLEKRLAGLAVNLYQRRWFDEHGPLHGLTVARVLHPLPTNQVLLLEYTPGA
jgi:SAM-dependent methyltransferase/uncharacterized membrane protein YbhN (UPF0104 family)